MNDKDLRIIRYAVKVLSIIDDDIKKDSIVTEAQLGQSFEAMLFRLGEDTTSIFEDVVDEWNCWNKIDDEFWSHCRYDSSDPDCPISPMESWNEAEEYESAIALWKAFKEDFPFEPFRSYKELGQWVLMNL